MLSLRIWFMQITEPTKMISSSELLPNEIQRSELGTNLLDALFLLIEMHFPPFVFHSPVSQFGGNPALRAQGGILKYSFLYILEQH